MSGRTPATLAQHGIWFTERVGAARSAYHMPLAIRFEGRLDTAALADACAAVVARHPALGAAFEERDGVPHVVRAGAPPRVEVEEVPAERLDEVVRRETLRPFDLRRGPLVRLRLLRLAPARSLLLLVAHHLVFDGESKDVFVRDLAACYRAGRERSAPGLAPLPDGHAGLVAREREGLGAAREFWTPRWHEPPDAVLPGLARSETAATPGETFEIEVDEELRSVIAGAADALGLTRFELLLAALQALLRRYGGRDVVVAVDVATRTAEARDCIGLFVNELPLAARPSLAGTFRALAEATRAGLRDLYRFRDVPLAQAVSGVRPRASLAPVSMSYRRRAACPAFPGLDVTVDWAMSNLTARNALHVQVVDGPEALVLSLQHSPRAIDRESVARIAGHLVALLRGVAGSPDARLADLPILAAEERLRLVTRWDGAAPAETVPELFAAQAARTPGELAVVCGPESLTYAQLDAATGGLAGRLRREGAGPGALVAVCAERSVGLVVGLLAVLRSGAAYVPLDPGYPARRLAHVVEDSGAALLLTQRPLLGRLPARPARVLMLEDAVEPAGPGPAVAAGPGDLAYVTYTSGSTGRPKGVEIEHRSLTNVLLALRPEWGGGVWLGLASPAFDISALELFLPLVTGGRVMLTPSPNDGAAVVRTVREGSVSHVQATPSGWRLLLAAGFDEPAVSALAGGEPLPPALARDVRTRCRRLANVYGPTETTVWSTMWPVGESVDAVSIGRPIANTQALVLDELLTPLAAGLPGELHIGGAGVARGYRGRPAETAARFVPNPYGPPGSRLYRTGDSVRMRPEGLLDFIGRTDAQVKVRGHRIELGEIEAVLLEHPGVRGAAAAVREDALVAYVVPAAGARPAAAELRGHLAAALPDHMVPAAFVTLERLPLTPGGKLDRGALPQPPRQRDVTEGQPFAYSGVAGDVHDIWCEVLRMDHIQPYDSLFELGGHSLTATMIAARIRKRLRVDVPLHVFYDTPTIAGIVEAIESRS